MSSLKYKLVRDVKDPQRSTDGSAGIDFFVPNDQPEVIVEPLRAVLIPSGVVMEFDKGLVLVAMNRSSVAKAGMLVGAQVVDQDYQGEIHIHLINTSRNKIKVRPGTKVIQLVLLPYEKAKLVKVEHIHTKKTKRGAGGFGSTDRKDRHAKTK